MFLKQNENVPAETRLIEQILYAKVRVPETFLQWCHQPKLMFID